jgi:hypothetical protein
MIQSLPIGDIRRDGGTQQRAEINMLVVAEYAESYRDGADMPPLVVFYDGSHFWLADGFHRHSGAEKAGLTEVDCDVRSGSLDDAIFFACCANTSHGLQRNNADKRRAVETMLKKWGTKKGDREISRDVCVTQPFVSKVRAELSDNGYQMDPVHTVTRGGTTYQQDTSNIGKKKPVAAQSDGGKGASTRPLANQSSMFATEPPEDEEEETEEEESGEEETSNIEDDAPTDEAESDNDEGQEEDEEEEDEPRSGPIPETPPQPQLRPRLPGPGPSQSPEEKGFERLAEQMNLFLCSLPRRGGIVAVLRRRGSSEQVIEGTYNNFISTRDAFNQCIQEMEETYPWLNKA